jgi:hypothetical protein
MAIPGVERRLRATSTNRLVNVTSRVMCATHFLVG